MSQHQNNTDNFVVTDQEGRIVEGPSSKEIADQKKQKLTENGARQEELKVSRLLTE